MCVCVWMRKNPQSQSIGLHSDSLPWITISLHYIVEKKCIQNKNKKAKFIHSYIESANIGELSHRHGKRNFIRRNIKPFRFRTYAQHEYDFINSQEMNANKMSNDIDSDTRGLMLFLFVVFLNGIQSAIKSLHSLTPGEECLSTTDKTDGWRVEWVENEVCSPKNNTSHSKKRRRRIFLPSRNLSSSCKAAARNSI